MPYNTYYASATQTGRNHAGTLSDPFSQADLFGVEAESYPSRLQRPCVVYLLPGGSFSSTNHNPNTFHSDDGDSSFYWPQSGNGTGYIIIAGYNPNSYTSFSGYPKILQIKTNERDIPLIFKDVCFYNGVGKGLVATGGLTRFVNCLFVSQSTTTINPIFTSLNRHGGHTTYLGCYVKAAPSMHASGEKICQLVAGYMNFVACWFDTWRVPIEGSDDACFYEACVFRQMDPAPPGATYAFPTCHSSDIKRCLFWRFTNPIVEVPWADPSAPQKDPISRIILINNLFYECQVPFSFYSSEGVYNSNSVIFGNVYYGASQAYDVYISSMSDYFAGNISMAFRRYNGPGNPLGEGRPVMYMNSAWPFPQNPSQYQVENSPDEVKAGLSAYDLHSFCYPQTIVRLGAVEEGRVIRVPFKTSPNYLPAPLGTWPAEELVIENTVSYGAYEEMSGTYREPNANFVLSAHTYGPPGQGERVGQFIPETNVNLDCQSLHFVEPPEEE